MQLNFKEYVNEVWSRFGAGLGAALGGFPGAALGGLAGWAADKYIQKRRGQDGYGSYTSYGYPRKGTFDYEHGEIDPEHIGYFPTKAGQAKLGILPQFQHLYS